MLQESQELRELDDYLNSALDLLSSIHFDLEDNKDLNLYEDVISSNGYKCLDLDNSKFLGDPFKDQLDHLRDLWETDGVYDPVANPELFDSWFDPDIYKETADSSSLFNDSKSLSDISYDLFAKGIQKGNLQMVNKSLDASYSIFLQVPDYLRDIIVYPLAERPVNAPHYYCKKHEWKDIGSNQPAMVHWRCSGCNSGPHIAILECVHCKIKRCGNCTLKR